MEERVIIIPRAYKELIRRRGEIEDMMHTVINKNLDYQWALWGKQEFYALQTEYKATCDEIRLIETFYSKAKENE